MADLIHEIFSAFTITIEGLTTGIKNAFLNVLYVDPDAPTKVLSDFARFGFIMLGLGLAIGLVWGAVRLIRGRA